MKDTPKIRLLNKVNVAIRELNEKRALRLSIYNSGDDFNLMTLDAMLRNLTQALDNNLDLTQAQIETPGFVNDLIKDDKLMLFKLKRLQDVEPVRQEINALCRNYFDKVKQSGSWYVGFTVKSNDDRIQIRYGYGDFEDSFFVTLNEILNKTQDDKLSRQQGS